MSGVIGVEQGDAAKAGAVAAIVTTGTLHAAPRTTDRRDGRTVSRTFVSIAMLMKPPLVPANPHGRLVVLNGRSGQNTIR
jgi:hypothetical protein